MLYYARAVDPTMLPTTNHIASLQAQPTLAVKEQAIRLLQYPNNAIVFKKSKMHVILQVDASYLSRSKARSVAGGIAYFGDAANPTIENGMIHAISSIIDVVVASAGEAEYGSAFILHSGESGYARLLSHWAMRNQPPPYCVTTLLQLASPMTPSSKNGPKALTCAFTGFVTAFGRASSPLHISLARLTWRTSSPKPCLVHTTTPLCLALCSHQALRLLT
jgi:hypothetical protein